MSAMNAARVQMHPDIEMLLPWYAAGSLSARDMLRVEAALAQHPELGRQVAAAQQEHAEIIALNESLGAPQARVMRTLFAAIDAEPARPPVPGPVIKHGVLQVVKKNHHSI